MAKKPRSPTPEEEEEEAEYEVEKIVDHRVRAFQLLS
jgi:hypothetical protein